MTLQIQCCNFRRIVIRTVTKRKSGANTGRNRAPPGVHKQNHSEGGYFRRSRNANSSCLGCLRTKSLHLKWRRLLLGDSVNRANSLRTAAKIMHKSLLDVEQSPEVDPAEAPFLKLKSSVLDTEAKLQEKASAIETPFPEETTD
jgi:hypothetical protein